MMSLGIRTDDRVGDVEEIILLLGMVGFSVPEYWREPDRAIYCEVVWTQANDFAVSLMEFQERLGPLPAISVV
jgi:hypothetical protein